MSRPAGNLRGGFGTNGVMMDGVSGMMTLGWVIGILLVILLVVTIAKLLRK